MNPEEVDEMMKIADPKGEGIVDIMEFADSICPPKVWILKNIILYRKSSNFTNLKFKMLN